MLPYASFGDAANHVGVFEEARGGAFLGKRLLRNVSTPRPARRLCGEMSVRNSFRPGLRPWHPDDRNTADRGPVCLGSR